MQRVVTGLDRLIAEGLALPGRGRVAVLCNATTVAADWRPTVDALHAAPKVDVRRILSPQHGFAAEKQDNMRESADGAHPRLGIPIVSLYGDAREPRPEAFDGIDAVLVDLQDVGTRVYTFAVTALLVLRAACRAGVPVIILDRPNPIGGAIEGPVLEPGFHSFVGIVDVPLRHGLTLGELCLYGAWRLGLLEEAAVTAGARAGAAAGHLDCGCLRILPLRGWRRSLHLDETDRPWCPPSPNLPLLESAVVYPGQVALEGTNLSEGRGTTRPFESCGAPYLDPRAVAHELERRGAARVHEGGYAGALFGDGFLLREIAFEPTFQKYAGATARGFHLHVTDRRCFRPVAFTVTLLAAVRATAGAAFAWREPPYEYEWDRPAIDLIFGTDQVRRALETGGDPQEIARSFRRDELAFDARARICRLYGE